MSGVTYESPAERDALFCFLDDMKRSWGRMQVRVLMGPFGPFTMSREKADAVVADWREARGEHNA